VAATKAEPWPALVAPLDPQHEDPNPNLVAGQVNWVADTLVPMLPDELIGDQYLQLPVVGGPLDMEPETHTYGVGPGPGLSDEQNRAVMERWHTTDRGAPEARRWQPQAARDGSYSVDVVPDGDGGASPATVALRHETGLGEPNDPHARRGYRIQRVRSRWIDRHMWGVAKRPVHLRNAYVDPSQPQEALGQYVTPFPGGTAGWSGRDGMGTTPDQAVMPQERRTPRPWDEGYTTDGTVATGAGFGLGSWGL
jgi:hypothetical protein